MTKWAQIVCIFNIHRLNMWAYIERLCKCVDIGAVGQVNEGFVDMAIESRAERNGISNILISRRCLAIIALISRQIS